MEHAVNRAFTTLSYNGTRTALFGDGKDHPSLGVTADGKVANDSCISDPNSKGLHQLLSESYLGSSLQFTLRMRQWLQGPRLPFHTYQI